MIVIGTDTHKFTHALAAVDEGTGRVRGSREIDADDAGHLAAVKWARSLDDERVWAIEDCRHVSRRLEQSLIAAGERVVRVAPHRMGASRKGEREPGKSDEIDSLAVARAVVKDGVEQFPAAYLDERARECPFFCGRDRGLTVSNSCDYYISGVFQSGIRSPKWIFKAASAAVQPSTDRHLVSARWMAR